MHKGITQGIHDDIKKDMTKQIMVHLYNPIHDNCSKWDKDLYTHMKRYLRHKVKLHTYIDIYTVK